ncbi:MAG: flagellar FliJ family protein [Phycisphaerales bacterium]|nr:flagellar FliJ family protein [Phycisphaerales bacterium]
MERRFTFRFGPLLRLRQQHEDEQKRVVASRLGEIRRLEERQRTLLGRIEEQTDLTRDALRRKEVDLDHLKMSRHWMIRLRRGVLETEAEIATHKALLAQERSKLSEASKETKVLSRLKERRWERFLAEQERRERVELDEMNVLRFAHAELEREDEPA